MFKKIIIGVFLSLSIVSNLFLINEIKSFNSTNINLKQTVDNLESEKNTLTNELDKISKNLEEACSQIDDLESEKDNLSIELATLKGGLSKAQDAINNTLNTYED